MDHSLAGHGVFRCPLLTESGALGLLADGAVTLLAVPAIIGMALRAFCLARILGRDAVAKQCILFGGDEPQMGGIDALAVPADVVNDHARCDVSHGLPVGDSMGSPVLAPEPEHSISIPIKRSHPMPASIGAPKDVAIEALKFPYGHAFHAGHYIPCLM